MDTSTVKKNKQLAFIIMPFSKAVSVNKAYAEMDKDALDTVYSDLKDILEWRFEIRRAQSSEDILKDVILDLDRADLVIADLTSLNPNVMYELGIRHGFCKKTILITQDRAELPFDISRYYCIEYKWVNKKDKEQFKKEILELLNLMDKHKDPRHGPVYTHLGTKSLGVFDYENRATLRQLRALLKEISFLTTSIDAKIVFLSKKYPNAIERINHLKFTIDEDQLSETEKTEILKEILPPVNLPCIDMFLSLNYVPDEYDSFKEVSKLSETFLTIRNFGSHAHKLQDNPISWLSGRMKFIMMRVIQLIVAIETKQTGQELSKIDFNQYTEN